jgi:hypothetical protein
MEKVLGLTDFVKAEVVVHEADLYEIKHLYSVRNSSYEF